MKLKLVLVVLVLALPSLMLPRAARADSLTTGGNAGGGPCTSATNSTSCSGVFTGPFISGVFSANAVGSLASGTMGTSASIQNYENLNLPGGNATSADAIIGMFYEFAEPTSLDGGTVLFSIVLSGETSSSCTIPSTSCTIPYAQTQLILPSPSNEAFLGLGSGSTTVILPNGGTDIEVSSTIEDGVANLGLDLYSLVECNLNTVGSNMCSASSDFLDPLSITGATVYDANGNFVPGASVVSASGFNPNAVGAVATPEPSSLLLLGIGLFAIGLTMSAHKRSWASKLRVKNR